MTKQKLNKILIISLTIIWSFVAYSFISRYSAKKELALQTTVATTTVVKPFKRKGLQLVEIARDPFLGTYVRPTPVREVNARPSSAKKKKISVPDVWPAITYHGFVQNENSRNPLVLVNIDGSLKRIRKGDDAKGLIIREVWSDSIMISKGKEKLIFLKE